MKRLRAYPRDLTRASQLTSRKHVFTDNSPTWPRTYCSKYLPFTGLKFLKIPPPPPISKIKVLRERGVRWAATVVKSTPLPNKFSSYWFLSYFLFGGGGLLQRILKNNETLKHHTFWTMHLPSSSGKKKRGERNILLDPIDDYFWSVVHRRIMGSNNGTSGSTVAKKVMDRRQRRAYVLRSR
jgi:hypothetical protein